MAAESSIFSAAVDILKFPPTAFPKGKALQKNLDTHYVNLAGLFFSLAHEGFGGTILMVFEEGSEALIVFREGTIITAFEFHKERHTGIDALSKAMQLAREHKAYVDVFKMEHEMLVAVLPLLHGVQIHHDRPGMGVEEMMAEFKKAEFTGAVVAGDNVPEAVGLMYGGVPMGWFDAQGIEHETGSVPPPMRTKTFRAFALEGADTFATVNLELDKAKMAIRLRDSLYGELRELGMVLYEQARKRKGIEDERKTSKVGYAGLIEDVERSLAVLRGPATARRVTDSLNGIVDTMIDVGF